MNVKKAIIWQMCSLGMTREIPLSEQHGTTQWAGPDFFFFLLVFVVAFAKLAGGIMAFRASDDKPQ